MGSVFTEESEMHTPHHLLPGSSAHRCQEAPRTWHLEAQPWNHLLQAALAFIPAAQASCLGEHAPYSLEPIGTLVGLGQWCTPPSWAWTPL